MKPLTRITDFVMEQAATQPVACRIRLYRDLAAISATAEKARQLTSLAADLAAIEARHDQLVLDFKRNGGTRA